ncbi:hypothetical protein Poly24_21890 [Rosistilla carotiformis]|uniref:Uncharacterized protein n=1 Tax=Rosistilla carotiformis TaxID=2528017 RepID=A0A518JSG8_9BACT|nr:hypothetical protein [Rosistilla carotiformis]QDV68480.1 hypothetical protein Poly24_21890 [Rosistilla carotiformis]
MRGLVTCTALIGLTLLGGCRICGSDDDCAYPSYGGSWERTNRNHGRVGSIFAPAGAKVAGTAMPQPVFVPPPSAEPEESPDVDAPSLLDDLESEMPELTQPSPLGDIDET